MMNSKAVFLTALMSVVLVGCSHTQPSRVSAPQAKAPSKELQLVNGCDIFTQDIALGLFQPAIAGGGTGEAVMQGPSDFVSGCEYNNGKTIGEANEQQVVLLLSGSSRAENVVSGFNSLHTRAKEDPIFASEPITLKGIGDDAFIASKFHEIIARKGKYFLRLTRYVDKETEKTVLENSQEQFKTTMIKILANLK